MNRVRQSCAVGIALLLVAVGPPAGLGSTGEVEEPPITAAERNHWAFRPLHRPAPPDVRNREQVRNPIDQFVLHRLEAVRLKLRPEAERRVLIRRLTFDLTGLPPTPEEIERFENDAAPDAWSRLIDRLLASPAYGERWAQHWLDLVRFAETDGFEHDKLRPEAWRYRDWVIQALNDDLPYDRFVQLQLAGDEFSPDDPGAAIATGFLLAGPDMPDLNLQEERRHQVLNEMTSTVGVAFLGLGMGCAQCHDHKYDPVSQADFYRLRAYFENTVQPRRDQPLGHLINETNQVAPAAHLMIRGDFRRPGPELQPAVPRITRLGDEVEGTPGVTALAHSSGRRKALAEWVTRPDHPLALRVIANRLWQFHFGKPLVSTPNDFGFQGGQPTHPELLYWLATELPRRDWSLKAMHRLIVSSATYRQQSSGSGGSWDRALQVDPDNQRLSRMHRNRLDGEAIRDAMLAAAGSLNRAMGGPGVRPPLSPEITITLLKDQWQVTTNVADHDRRSIYLFARRNLRYPMFDAFDRPDANASCARRHESTTAPQSLMLLNSGFSLEMSRRLAGTLSKPEIGKPVELVDRAWVRVLGRQPSAGERRAAERFLDQQAEELKRAGRPAASLALPLPPAESGDPYRQAALVDLCLALFNLSEFVYVD